MIPGLDHPELKELAEQPLVRAWVRLLHGDGLQSVAHVLPPGMAAALAEKLNEGLTLTQALSDPAVINTIRAAADEVDVPSQAEVILDILNQLGRCPHCGGHALLSRFGGVPDGELRALEAEVARATHAG